jgi:D-serine deaminase-like pyridoxal phosphate-dependent protein
VYVFFDLVMAGIGVCTQEDIALSVLTCVIGHQPEKGWIIVDAGWMAMSRDRGTHKQAVDHGYGAVWDVDGVAMMLLRIAPNHACATAAQHSAYHVMGQAASLQAWPRFSGW